MSCFVQRLRCSLSRFERFYGWLMLAKFVELLQQAMVVKQKSGL